MTEQSGQENLPKFIVPREQPKDRSGYKYHDQQLPLTETATNILWVFGSWSIVILNITLVILSIRDMISNGYQPAIHWFASAAFVATIGGLVTIHNYIINRK